MIINPSGSSVNVKIEQIRGAIQLEAWLQVTCQQCGILAHGQDDEIASAEKIQRDHADEKVTHWVNVELFSVQLVSTCINTIEGTPTPDEFQIDRS